MKNPNFLLKIAILQRFGTQRKFARKIRVHESIISGVVKGRINLTPEEQEQWAEKLGCTRGEIFPEAAKSEIALVDCEVQP